MNKEMTLKAQAMTIRDKLYLIKIKNFYASKDIVNRVKRQPTE